MALDTAVRVLNDHVQRTWQLVIKLLLERQRLLRWLLVHHLHHDPSLLRVMTEHAHSCIKRLHLVADTFRLRGEWPRDMAMVVACGLHNLRVRSRYRAYFTQAPAKLSTSSE